MNVEYCYRLLFAQLNKNHSEIRYSTFQIIDQLFQRSHHFRTLLLNDFNHLIEQCLGKTDGDVASAISNDLSFLGLTVDHQLPPPHHTARLLKQFAVTSIKKWHEKFGSTYKLLDIGHNYLKNCKFVNFDNIDEPIGITAELQRERTEANRIRQVDKLQKATAELNGSFPFDLISRLFITWNPIDRHFQ